MQATKIFRTKCSMQIYADADLASVMNYHPPQTIDQSYVFDKCPTFFDSL